jgi:hypothetical protein
MILIELVIVMIFAAGSRRLIQLIALHLSRLLAGQASARLGRWTAGVRQGGKRPGRETLSRTLGRACFARLPRWPPGNHIGPIGMRVVPLAWTRETSASRASR